MNLDQAVELLNSCVRSELRDHSFGDAEVFWEKDGREIAQGYFGAGVKEVSVRIDDEEQNQSRFVGDDARRLRECGTEGEICRNDVTGPEMFVEGKILPGLTLDGVYQELTGGTG